MNSCNNRVTVLAAICFECFSVGARVGTSMGLVGCIESLVVAGSGNEHDYDIFYPESDDVISGMGISASTMMFAHVVSSTCMYSVRLSGLQASAGTVRVRRCRVETAEVAKPFQTRPTSTAATASRASQVSTVPRFNSVSVTRTCIV